VMGQRRFLRTASSFRGSRREPLAGRYAGRRGPGASLFAASLARGRDRHLELATTAAGLGEAVGWAGSPVWAEPRRAAGRDVLD
jgi:hypothetical protein